MWKGLLIGVIALGGCASPAEIRMNADMHVAKANARRAQGDYYGANREMQKAYDQYHKADMRAYHEQYWW